MATGWESVAMGPVVAWIITISGRKGLLSEPLDMDQDDHNDNGLKRR